MSHIVNFAFDSGKLRHGKSKGNHDKDGDPIVSQGTLSGDGLIPISTDVTAINSRYKIQITAANNPNMKWTGRIVSGVFDQSGSFLHWAFVVVDTAYPATSSALDEAEGVDVGEGELAILVQLFNPVGVVINEPFPTTVPTLQVP
jgi:hypothetical protein